MPESMQLKASLETSYFLIIINFYYIYKFRLKYFKDSRIFIAIDGSSIMKNKFNYRLEYHKLIF